MNKSFESKYHRKIWVDEKILANGIAFNGSTSFIMNPDYSDSDIIKYKPSAGDLDITVEESLKDDMWDYLDSIEGQEIIPGATYFGSNKHTKSSIGDQINSVIVVHFENGTVAYCQVDFEFLPFEDSHPTAWAKFSHSSSFEDARAGVKAVNHKFLIRALVGGASVRDDIVIATGKSTPEKITLSKSKVHALPRMLKFSVVRGIRIAYEPMFDHDGNVITIDGKQVYKEIPSKNSSFETVIENIYKLAFGRLDSHPKDIKKFDSFVGVLDLMKEYLTKSQIKDTHDRYIELLWGTKGARGQELEVDNAELDFQVKNAGYQRFIKEFGLPDKSEKQVNEYYAKYGQRGRVRESFRSLLESYGF